MTSLSALSPTNTPTASGVNRPQWAISLSATLIRWLCGPGGMAACEFARTRSPARSIRLPREKVSDTDSTRADIGDSVGAISMSAQPTFTSMA